MLKRNYIDLDKTLPDIGLKMKTGLTVDFRNRSRITFVRCGGRCIHSFIRSILNKEKYISHSERNPVSGDRAKGLIGTKSELFVLSTFTAKEEGAD